MTNRMGKQKAEATLKKRFELLSDAQAYGETSGWNSRNATVAFAGESTPLTTSLSSRGHAAGPSRRHPNLAMSHLEDSYASCTSERSSVPRSQRHDSIFPDFHNLWLPDVVESDEQDTIITNSLASPTRGSQKLHHHHDHHDHNHDHVKRFPHRSIKRRMFLFLSEPTSSKGSAIFYLVLISAILTINIVMVMQTMDYWQYTPDDCISCGG